MTIHATDQSVYSRRQQAIGQCRKRATDGRIDRAFDSKSPFSEKYARLIGSDHEGILQHVYLKSELETFERILAALQREPGHHGAQELNEIFNRRPGPSGYQSFLCPVARFAYGWDIFSGALRYFFSEVFNQLMFLTVVMDFAPDLETLTEKIEQARKQMVDIGKGMGRKKRGVVMFGAFEPDLRTGKDFAERSDLRHAVKDLGWTVDEAGGWVLSGHFVVRAVDVDLFRKLVRTSYPAKTMRRVKFKPFNKKLSVGDNLTNMVRYILKTNEAFDKFPEATPKRLNRLLDEHLAKPLIAAGVAKDSIPEGIDPDHAVRQLAIFLHNAGFDKLMFSYESGHAQRWYNQQETLMFLEDGHLEEMHGYCKIEVHRDDGVSGKKPRRRARALTPASSDMPISERVCVGPAVGYRIAG
tara:strand:- start:17 stop:1255 length:1239 start_codon:yes stop_codon:yes gene_type:complete